MTRPKLRHCVRRETVTLRASAVLKVTSTTRRTTTRRYFFLIEAAVLRDYEQRVTATTQLCSDGAVPLQQQY
jgi:hypothetical protein